MKELGFNKQDGGLKLQQFSNNEYVWVSGQNPRPWKPQIVRSFSLGSKPPEQNDCWGAQWRFPGFRKVCWFHLSARKPVFHLTTIIHPSRPRETACRLLQRRQRRAVHRSWAPIVDWTSRATPRISQHVVKTYEKLGFNLASQKKPQGYFPDSHDQPATQTWSSQSQNSSPDCPTRFLGLHVSSKPHGFNKLHYIFWWVP
jgi:hypothetical protein